MDGLADKVKYLRDISGCGIQECKEALFQCKNADIAYEFLKLRTQAALRCKINDGVRARFTTEDYVELAKANTAKKQNNMGL